MLKYIFAKHVVHYLRTDKQIGKPKKKIKNFFFKKYIHIHTHVCRK